MADDDPVAAELGPIRERIAELDTLIERMKTSAVDIHVFNAAQDRLAEATPRLLSAVDKVLALAADAKPKMWQAGTDNAVAWTLDPEALRSAVLAGLTGKGGDGDR
jgi:hypothetical protein